MLNRNGKSRCFYHFPNFNGKAFNILLLTIMLTVGISRYLLSGWRESLVCWDFPFNSELMSIFSAFVCDYHMVFLIFILLRLWINFIDFWILNKTLIPANLQIGTTSNPVKLVNIAHLIFSFFACVNIHCPMQHIDLNLFFFVFSLL